MTTINTILRDGSNVDMPALRNYLADLQGSLAQANLALATGTIATLVGDRVYATQSALYADLVPADNLFALVFADSDPLKNGLYQKDGATTAGDWDGPFDLFSSGAEALVQPLLDDAEAAADAAAASAAAASGLLLPLSLAQSKINASFSTLTETALDRPSLGTFGTGDSIVLAVALRVGVDVPASTPLAYLTIPIAIDDAAVTRIVVKRSKRAVADAWLNDVPGNAGDTDIDELVFSLADLGLVSAVGGIAAIPLGGQSGEVDDVLLFEVSAEDNSGNQYYNDLARASGTGLSSQYQRGWFRYEGQPPGDWNGIPPTFALALSVTTELFDIGLAAAAAESVFLANRGSVTNAGYDVTVDAVIYGYGGNVAASDEVTLNAPASGKERIDLILADRLTGVVSIEEGDERDEKLDAIEWQPAVPAGKIVLARAVVRDGDEAHVADATGFRGLIRIGSEGEMSAHVARNRGLLRGVLGKAMRGEAIKWGGYGDSITAIQTGAPVDATARYAANGDWRDRRSVYFSEYPSDTLALLPLYDFGDGSGAVHTKIGWNWTIKSALDAIAGDDVVDYLNYGIGSTKSDNSAGFMSLGDGLWPARIAVPKAASLDAVMIAFGMNERGATTTYANIVDMIEEFVSVGTVPIVMGCPRPNTTESVTDWRYTCDALEAAAMDAGAAFVSTAALADDRNLGAMGVPAQALGSTNVVAAGNHPGIYELNQYGRAAVEQLGLV